MRHRSRETSYFRNFVFGVEDSLVSTVGLLSGIAIAGMERESIFLAGIVLIFVEAFSMAAGSYLSESSAREYAGEGKRSTSVFAALVMFVSYFVSGFIPLSSYLIWNVEEALPYSVIFSLFALLVLGVIGARLSKTSLAAGALRMTVVGGIAIAIGMGAGMLVPLLGTPSL